MVFTGEIEIIGLIIRTHERLFIVVVLLSVVIDAAGICYSSCIGGGMGEREQIAIDTTLELFVFRLIGIIEAAEKERVRLMDDV